MEIADLPTTGPLRPVKCGCGDVMRAKAWSAHWNGCRVGSSVPVQDSDRQNLLDYEDYMRKKYDFEVSELY